jgi:hypothetical protein
MATVVAPQVVLRQENRLGSFCHWAVKRVAPTWIAGLGLEDLLQSVAMRHRRRARDAPRNRGQALNIAQTASHFVSGVDTTAGRQQFSTFSP